LPLFWAQYNCGCDAHTISSSIVWTHTVNNRYYLRRTTLAKRYGLIPPDGSGIYGPGETLTYACQRLLTRNTPAREFSRSMISKNPFANAVAPPNDAFKRLAAGEFRDWRLVVDGTVAHPMSLSLADLKSLGLHSQITEVACEEGWSYIAEWIGTPLSVVLREAGVLPQTQYVDPEYGYSW